MRNLDLLVKDSHAELFEAYEKSDKRLGKFLKITLFIGILSITLGVIFTVFVGDYINIDETRRIISASLYIIIPGFLVVTALLGADAICGIWLNYREEINNAIQEKIREDLKNNYDAVFLDPNAPRINGEEYEDYKIKKSNGEIFNALISYDENNEIKVSVSSQILELKKENNCDKQKKPIDFDIIDSLKDIDD